MNTKPQLAQVTNYVGALVGIVGNLLPIITPDFLTACGVSPTTAHVWASVGAALLIAYQEKKPVSPTTPPESSK